MSLNFFLNCIVLILGCQGILALPSPDGEKPGQNISVDVPCLKSIQPDTYTNIRNVAMQSVMCSCDFGRRGLIRRDDYHHSPGIGLHKFHTRSVPWNKARRICNEEGGHLAIINSLAEAQVLRDLFNNAGPIKGAQFKELAFLGMHDLYAEGDWVTVLDESLSETGYTLWTNKWGGQPDNGGGKQHCGALVKNDAMDDIYCEIALPFICELPEMQFT